MIYHYKYYDDEKSEVVEPRIDALMRTNSQIKIEYEQPSIYTEIIQAVKEQVDGLILDLQIDQFANDEGKKADFKSFTLVQELRSRGAEKEINEFPIILWSAEKRWNRFRDQENVIEQLFDAQYTKEEVTNNLASVSNQLVSLAKGYREIQRLRGKRGTPFYNLLRLTPKQYQELDTGITEKFPSQGWRTAHSYAKFILQKMLGKPGPLVDEALLASRLGVSIESSGDDWKKLLKDHLIPFYYQGVFSEMHHRWWFHMIEHWWKQKIKEKHLSFLNAAKRVELIKKYTRFKKLSPAQPYQKNAGERFWTICKVTKIPLEPIDGIMLGEVYLTPWQEREYISIEAALERKHIQEKLKIHPMETERLNALRENNP